MKVAIFGAGGVGGYFGSRLAAGGADVHLIARGRHLEALQKNGLRVRSANGDYEGRLPATESTSEIGTSDVVLFCVKSMDTEKSLAALEPLLGPDTFVLSLQNGVDNEDRLAEALGARRIVGGVTYILATIGEPGVIVHQGTIARLIAGELDRSRSERLERFVSLCRKSGIDAEVSLSIRTDLWRKFAMICATAGMTAAVRLPIGEIRTSPAALEMFRRIASEVLDVGAAEGVSIPANTIDQMLHIASSVPGDWYSSLHYDMTHGKPMELDALHGSVVRRARRHQVPVPMCEAVYAILEPWALRQHRFC